LLMFSVMGPLQVLQYRLSGQGIRSGRKQSTLICRVQDALVKVPPFLNDRAISEIIVISSITFRSETVFMIPPEHSRTVRSRPFWPATATAAA